MTIVNESRSHGFITEALNIILLTYKQQKICVFMFYS